MVEQPERIPGLLDSVPYGVRDATPCFGLSAKDRLRFTVSGARSLDSLTRERIGLSTFEFQLEESSLARRDDPIDIESCLAHPGGSSMRFCHGMTNARTGERIADLGQFDVDLDLDARRPPRIPDHVRERAREMMAGLCPQAAIRRGR